MATTSLIYLRRTRPDLPRPIKVHMSLPFIFLGCCIFLVLFPIITEPASTGQLSIMFIFIEKLIFRETIQNFALIIIFSVFVVK